MICRTCSKASGLSVEFSSAGARIHADFNPNHEMIEQGDYLKNRRGDNYMPPSFYRRRRTDATPWERRRKKFDPHYMMLTCAVVLVLATALIVWAL